MTFPSPVSHAPMLLELRHKRATRHGQRRLFSFLEDAEGESSELTSARLWQHARALGAFPRQQQVAAGEQAVLLYPPGLDSVSGFFGGLAAGGVWIRR